MATNSSGTIVHTTHTELMGVIIIFSDISDMFKIVSLWSHLKVFSGIEKKKSRKKKIFFDGEIFFQPLIFLK